MGLGVGGDGCLEKILSTLFTGSLRLCGGRQVQVPINLSESREVSKGMKKNAGLRHLILGVICIL